MNQVNTELSQKNTNWLQRLKDESWEAELLVSAVSIYAILQSFTVLDWLIIQFLNYLNQGQYIIGYFIIVFGFLAIGVLAAMFSIHFTLRAYWIGLVGLNSVFPDYSLEDSAYSPIYTKKILAILPKLPSSIGKIDELCSVIFSAAFALMLIYSYGTISTILYLLVFNFLNGLLPANLSWVLWVPLLLLGMIFIFGALISIPANLKKFHNNETIQHLYFIYARWGSFLFYGPIYKSVLQITMIFASNFKRKKGLVKMVIFMLLIGAGFAMVKLLNSDFRYLLNFERKPDTTKIELQFYSENNQESTFILTPEINGPVIAKNTVQLFIPILVNEIRIFRETCNLNDNFTFKDQDDQTRQDTRKKYLACYTAKHTVYLNNTPVAMEFLKTDHPVTRQFGIVGYLDVSTLEKGNHRLKVTKNLST
jgi:hypothetical protein